jgi:hypothetical protein
MGGAVSHQGEVLFGSIASKSSKGAIGWGIPSGDAGTAEPVGEGFGQGRGAAGLGGRPTEGRKLIDTGTAQKVVDGCSVHGLADGLAVDLRVWRLEPGT